MKTPRDMAQTKLNEHKKELKDTHSEVAQMSSGPAKDALKAVLPIFDAEAEVMQAIVDAISDNQLLA